MNPFKRGPDRVTTMEIVLEALLSLLIKKKFITRDQLQRQILKNGEDGTTKD